MLYDFIGFSHLVIYVIWKDKILEASIVPESYLSTFLSHVPGCGLRMYGIQWVMSPWKHVKPHSNSGEAMDGHTLPPCDPVTWHMKQKHIILPCSNQTWLAGKWTIQFGVFFPMSPPIERAFSTAIYGLPEGCFHDKSGEKSGSWNPSNVGRAIINHFWWFIPPIGMVMTRGWFMA